MATLKDKVENILNEKNEKIIPSNLPSGISIFDVNGSIPVWGDGDYIRARGNQGEIIDSSSDLIFKSHWERAIIDANGGIRASYEDVAPVIGLTSDKIKQGETILGVTGTYEGSGSSDKLYHITVEDAEEQYDEETSTSYIELCYYLTCNGDRIGDTFNETIYFDDSTNYYWTSKVNEDIGATCICRRDGNMWVLERLVAYNNTSNIYKVFAVNNNDSNKREYTGITLMPKTCCRIGGNFMLYIDETVIDVSSDITFEFEMSN